VEQASADRAGTESSMLLLVRCPGKVDDRCIAYDDPRLRYREVDSHRKPRTSSEVSSNPGHTRSKSTKIPLQVPGTTLPFG
jgi:hypothetical protein